MRHAPALALVCTLFACAPRDAQLEHVAVMEFGGVSLGESRELELELKNRGEKLAGITLTSDAADFTVGELGRTLAPGESAKILVRFTPTALGTRTGTLHLALSSLTLSGRGLGPELSAPSNLTLEPLSIITGQPSEVHDARITLRNTGTAGSLLTLGAPLVEGSEELCVGTFTDSTCVPWQPPVTLDTQTLLHVPIAILPDGEGEKRWTVKFPSNDPLRPEVTTEVITRVESFEPCLFSAPDYVAVESSADVWAVHLGSGRCQVQRVSVSPPELLELTAPHLPLRLERNERLELQLTVREGAPRSFVGAVHIQAAGTAPLDLVVRRELPESQCLTVSSPRIDFGDASLHCNAPTQNLLISNSCAEPIVVHSVQVTEAAGELPFTPNCPGQNPCPEFTRETPPLPVTIFPNGPALPITLRYRPINYGADRGEVRVSAVNARDLVLSLTGTGSSARRVDTFASQPLPVIDVLMMIDTSPSFAPRRQATRDNVLPLLNRFGDGCWNARVAFAAADGAPGANVELQPNDAGERWTASSDPLFVSRALSAFDTLPVGSEQEACVGPAADLIDDAGIRDGRFMGVCVTDALEGSPNPLGALARLQSHVAGTAALTWNAIAGFDVASCGVEASDDGVHSSLVAASNGRREDICAEWGPLVAGFGVTCQPRDRLYLTTRPAGALEVRIDGVDAFPGSWTYDATNNSVVFASAFIPPPGSTTTISYDVSCLP